MATKESKQTPIAVVGLACRLPGSCNSPNELWDFLLGGGVANTDTPDSRFHIQGHYDGTLRPWTMRSPGGMFIDSDPKDLDAGFFGLSHVDAVSMDPQQRQLLEVVYEGLENAGLTLEDIKSRSFGCFVGSYASDYDDMQTRDPEDRTPSTTVGTGRAMLSNRISHFLDIQGPSMTIDTACSGSLISVDLACRYLDSGDADGAIVAGCNLYLSPEHNMDQHAMSNAASPSGRCWTFDARADGYIKAEAVNVLILKRLDDAIRDNDPVRAVIRGTATNSDGRTPGIASPSPTAQAAAIRRAYARAGITNFTETAYLECHGTGTMAGDPMECKAAASVFSKARSPEAPLRIGSIKSNIGHSEPAAGISGVIKAVLAVEKGIVPGNPTFEIPNPNIDFKEGKILASKIASHWPTDAIRRASVNSFGYGGSNAHAIVEHPQILHPNYQSRSVTSFSDIHDDIFGDDEDHTRRLLVFSANNEGSLKSYIKKVIQHLANPGANITSADLAYTLSERRTRHFHRAFGISAGSTLQESNIVYTKPRHSAPRVGLVFTGQGAQWPQMGRELISRFPIAEQTIKRLDDALQSLPDPPRWSLLEELSTPRTAEHLRQPEFSQPLVTALQLALIAVIEDWGISPLAVIGHSSGEIAAAVAAGALSPETGLLVAYFRGKAAKDLQRNESNQQKALGMLAVGLGPEAIENYLREFPSVKIACRNSPNSVTLSGEITFLETLEQTIKNDGHFARLLQVNLAYHSDYMNDIASYYGALLEKFCPGDVFKYGPRSVKMFSTVSGALLHSPCGAEYWVDNMRSPVLFDQALSAMISDDGIDYLIEIGPSGALSGPIKQIKQNIGATLDYMPALTRGVDSLKPLYELAGSLFVSGIDINLKKVNGIDSPAHQPKVIIDLPNYQWDHSIKYWYESLASQDWRYRPFPVHDLLGTKVLGTSWTMPTWKRILRLKDVPWIRDHTLGSDIVFPASGYIAMAVEAVFQTKHANGAVPGSTAPRKISKVNDFAYQLRDVKFLRALTLEENMDCFLYFFLILAPGQGGDWHHFKIASNRDSQWTDHCQGYVQIIKPERIEVAASLPDFHASSRGNLWYKSMNDIGFNFGPTFRNLSEIDSIPGRRANKARIISPDPKFLEKQSSYSIHPCLFDSFFQAGIPAMYEGYRTKIEQLLVPQLIDHITINPGGANTTSAIIAETDAAHKVGRLDKVTNYTSNITLHDTQGTGIIATIKGLHYTELHTAEASNQSQNFMKSVWKPDISLLKNTLLENLRLSAVETRAWAKLFRLPQEAATLVSLLAHKLPSSSVLDLDMIAQVNEELNGYNDLPELGQLSTFKRYVSASTTTGHLLDAQRRWEGYAGTEFHIYDTKNSGESASFDSSSKFDLVILRQPHVKTEELEKAILVAKTFLSDNGIFIFVYFGTDSNEIGIDKALQSAGLEVLSKSPTVYLCTTGVTETRRSPQIQVVDLTKGSSDCGAFIDNIRLLGWEGETLDLRSAVNHPKNEEPLLVIDHPEIPILSVITDSDFVLLQKLVSTRKNLLWLTTGSQMEVSSPSNALIHGFSRTIRGEDPLLAFKTIDVSSYWAETSAQAVLTVARTLSQNNVLHNTEYEYCERDGMVYVSRIVRSAELMQIDRKLHEGAEIENMWLRKNPRVVRLHCEKIGSLSSLQYNEVRVNEFLEDHEVEVEIIAAGLNYKDIATCLGLVQENEHTLGLEGAGVIRRVGAAVQTTRVGDRVLVHGMGSFSNRIRVREEYVFQLPDEITFEQAATMSIVYFTAVFSLIEVAKVQKGDSILIHSAAGGVGLAAIHVAKYLGATIYATVGSDEKRAFLQELHGIPAHHIFSSRNTEFVTGIRAATNGKGVDCVINSLTGALLDESWRLLAHGGTFIEIGKKDIVDRNNLAMEPFNRNCSYRGIDISHPELRSNSKLVRQILQTVKKLLYGRYIHPITPMKVFSFNEIAEAIRYMRPGVHMGKIVISHGDQDDVQVPTRPLPLALNLDPKATYLIIGGLKGLCGSLAIYLARCGAKSITVVSRSGVNDERSQQVVRDLNFLGTKVIDAKGDITNPDVVFKVFEDSPLPIDGVIQGAMVLRDKTFESMTPLEFQQALSCKLQGTWNLHHAEEKAKRKFSFFTVLSSISGVIGTASQANYAAGNAFQDAFAAWRCSRGLAGHAVDLGIIEDVGYMSEHAGLTNRVRNRSQLPGINERKLHDILQLSILQQQVKNADSIKEKGQFRDSGESQMITGLPFPMSVETPLANDMRFICLLPYTLAGDGEGHGGDDDELRAFEAMLAASLPAERLVPEVVKLVNAQFVRLLGLSTAVEEAKPLSSYGLDSLAAVDLRNWLKVNLHAELTTLDVLNATSLRALCEKIVGRLIPPRIS